MRFFVIQRRWRYLAFALFAFMVGSASLAHAQQADIIRGRVIGPDSQPIANAAVLVTSLQGGISKQTKTNREGRFSVVFPNGEGDYWVAIAAIGFTQKKFEVKRIADEEILLADAKLGPVQLETTNVQAGVRQSAARNDNASDLSGTDRGLSNANVSAADAGNLAALAAGLPGFQLIPGLDGNPDLFSALGLSPDQNSNTLNGAQANGADLPRDAQTSCGVSLNAWDLSNGGFSGANVACRTSPGNNYKSRSTSAQLDAPGMQWTDNIGDATNARYTRLSASGQWSGPIVFDHDYFNSSFQFDHRFNDVANLFNTDPLGLRAAGVSADSAARLRSVLNTLGIPATVGGVPNTRTTDNLRLQGVLDFTPRSSTSGHAYQASGIFNYSGTDPVGTGLMSTPAFAGQTNTLAGSLVLRHTNYFWDKIVTESWLSGSINRTKTDPLLRYPTGSVLVNSLFDDSTTSLHSLAFGGSPSLNQERTTAFVDFRNQMRWLSESNRHTFKFTTELRNDRYDNVLNNNLYGSWGFLSLEDLAAGHPSSYSKTLAPQSDRGSQMVESFTVADAWRPAPTFQAIYSARVDANQFLATPDENPLVASTFGVSNTHVPSRVMPSVGGGFSWSYGESPQIPFQQGFINGPRARLNLGVGVLQNVGQANLISPALGRTGLPGSARQLVCIGPVAPIPQWDTYITDPIGTPSTCSDGSSIFANNLPSVTMFAPHFQQSRSIRPTLNWSSAVLGARYQASLTGVYSINQNQQGAVDLNFAPNQQFALANEANRPVFVHTASIDPVSGIASSRDSRVSQSFSSVTQLQSSLNSLSRQVTVGLQPLNYNYTRFTWNVNYTYLNYRDQYNGFSSTAGSPLTRAWGPSAVPHHIFGLTLTYNFWDYANVYFGARLQSGNGYTPVTDRDINGDGSGGNDRAFVFDPAHASDTAVVNGMQRLLAGNSNVSECLASQLGRIANRNSCRTPWQLSASGMSITINPIKVKLPPRANITISVNNPLAAADLMINGSNHLKGWGQPQQPDTRLLLVRGFDPGTQQYKYQVNSRFGSTNTNLNTNRQPVIVTAQVRLDVGPTRDWQSMKMQIDRGRTHQGTKASEASLKSYATTAVVINPMARILQTADILGLSRKQADSLASLSRGFSLIADSIWTPVTKQMAGLDSVYADGPVHDAFVRAREAEVNYLIKVAPNVKNLLTKSQLRRLPSSITNYLEPRYLERVRAGMVAAGLPISIGG